MTNRAQIAVSQAYLSSDFAEGMARRYFGDAIVNALPLAKKGKYMGRIKEHTIEWEKVVRGGWVRTGDATGYVENRVGSVIAVRLYHTPFRGDKTLVAEHIVERKARQHA